MSIGAACCEKCYGLLAAQGQSAPSREMSVNLVWKYVLFVEQLLNTLTGSAVTARRANLHVHSFCFAQKGVAAPVRRAPENAHVLMHAQGSPADSVIQFRLNS